MTFEVRRIVTGHDPSGKAVVESDTVMTDVISFRPGMESHVAWATDCLPADCRTGPAPVSGTTVAGGSVFRIIKYDPGVAPRMHRTESIDYAVVLSGKIDMVLDDSTVQLRQGDLMIQRGTIHDWVNRYGEPCIIAFVLISSKPLTFEDSALEAVG